MADFLRKFEAMYDYDQQSRKPSLTPRLCRFTVTPQRMRMIVEAFKDSLELGLAKPAQVVVSLPALPLFPFSANQITPAHDTYICIRLAIRE